MPFSFTSRLRQAVTKLLNLQNLALALVAAIFLAPAGDCQQSYKVGGTRVIQGSNLARPADTYITRGTLSPSAQIPVYGSAPVQPQSRYPQGYLTPAQAANNQQQGSQQMGGLPNARMGATVGMPGDYMRSDLNPNYSLRKQEVMHNGYVTIPTQIRMRPNTKPAVATYGSSGSAQSHSSGAASTATSTYGSSSSTSSYKGY
ncbi:MAG: hypothetical protein C0473_04360 [Cyanobacteria bacterium DS3.002]|nr:hypothetical protein [Cyanobacteria bacterium DS3.002]